MSPHKYAPANQKLRPLQDLIMYRALQDKLKPVGSELRGLTLRAAAMEANPNPRKVVLPGVSIASFDSERWISGHLESKVTWVSTPCIMGQLERTICLPSLTQLYSKTKPQVSTVPRVVQAQ